MNLDEIDLYSDIEYLNNTGRIYTTYSIEKGLTKIHKYFLSIENELSLNREEYKKLLRDEILLIVDEEDLLKLKIVRFTEEQINNLLKQHEIRQHRFKL